MATTASDSPTSSPEDIPEGFFPIDMGGPFVFHNGGLLGRWTGSRLQLGFRVREHHCNPKGGCHGGMLATFCDMLLPAISLYQGNDGRRRFLPTVSLQIDYLGPAALGSWVQGEGEVLRRTRNLLFAQGLVTADGAMALRVSGTFRYRAEPETDDDGIDDDPLKLKAGGAR